MKALRAVGGFLLAASMGGCGLDLMYADWKVDRLCQQDGGVSAMAQERAPDWLLSSNGDVDIDALLRPKPEQEYFLTSTSTYIQSDEPRILRSEYRLYRRTGNVLLGISVVYHRVGQNTSIPLLSRKPHRCPEGNQLAKLVDGVFEVRKRVQ
jgi:hypothetical protein